MYFPNLPSKGAWTAQDGNNKHELVPHVHLDIYG